MQKIEFTDDLRLGIKVVDDQHRKLVDLINGLIDLEADEGGSDAIPRALDELADYIEIHFQAEEEMMKAVDFPAFAEHRLQHAEFVKKTLQFNREYRIGGDNLGVDMLIFLSTWLIDHIKGEDPKFVPFFKAHGF